jgi:hypothetical protein
VTRTKGRRHSYRVLSRLIKRSGLYVQNPPPWPTHRLRLEAPPLPSHGKPLADADLTQIGRPAQDERKSRTYITFRDKELLPRFAQLNRATIPAFYTHHNEAELAAIKAFLSRLIGS